MPASYVVALGLLGILTVLRFIQRGTLTNRMRTLLMDTKDPEAAKQKLHELFANEDAKETDRRAELWQRAQTDVGAAKMLRKLLQDYLKGYQLTRVHFVNSSDGDAISRALEEQRAETEQQLARVEALIQQFKR